MENMIAYYGEPKVRRMVCPNGCNSHFTTTGHIMQEWEVDCQGHYIQVTEECLQVTHDADFDNVWICTSCGAEGIPDPMK